MHFDFPVARIVVAVVTAVAAAVGLALDVDVHSVAVIALLGHYGMEALVM